MKWVLLAIFTILQAGCGVEWFPGPQANVAIGTTTLPNATVNVAYSQALSAFGGIAPYTWSVASGTLPTGLTLGADGVLSGTPTTAGSSNFSVKVTDSSSPATTATQALTLQVTASTSGTPTATLTAGQSSTLASGQSVLVPVGSTITLNGAVTNVTGASTTLSTSAGAIVSVPATATGTAVVTITAQ